MTEESDLIPIFTCLHESSVTVGRLLCFTPVEIRLVDMRAPVEIRLKPQEEVVSISPP